MTSGIMLCQSSCNSGNDFAGILFLMFLDGHCTVSLLFALFLQR